MNWHIIGDVHGQIHQLRALLQKLGYHQNSDDPYLWTPPPGCMLVSVGDVVDRGPDSLACIRTLMRMEQAGHAEMVLGNHDVRYREMLAHLLGEDPVLHGRPESRLIAYLQLLGLPRPEQQTLADWLDARPLHYEIEGAIVVHAAWTNGARGKAEICAFGRGHTQQHNAARHLPPVGRGLLEFGRETTLPTRVGWVHGWRGPATVIWGHHVVVPGAVTRIGKTLNVESGCFAGHALSAYHHPGGELTQTTGTRRHWRNHLAPFLDAQGALFPISLSGVREVLVRESLRTVDDYIAWVQLECESRGTPPIPREILAAHRSIFAVLEA